MRDIRYLRGPGYALDSGQGMASVAYPKPGRRGSSASGRRDDDAFGDQLPECRSRTPRHRYRRLPDGKDHEPSARWWDQTGVRSSLQGVADDDLGVNGRKRSEKDRERVSSEPALNLPR